MVKVLLVRPDFELATHYGSVWLGEVRRIAEDLGHTVLDLYGDDATPENIYDALENFKPELVFMMGHGNQDTYTSQNTRVVFKACTNDEKMAGTQAYFLSCLMGVDLCPSMNRKGAVTVAGYITEFVWVVHPDYRDDPLNDPRAYPFMRAVVESCSRLLEGGSWRDFYNTFVKMCDLGISEWFNSSDPTAPQIVAALEQDRDSLVIYGETVIRPVPPVLAVPSLMPAIVGVTLISAFM
ncbi:MAG: hypothetical protein ACTSSA_13955 [Candidatus Freyarchaeota archaeon]